MLCCCWGGPPLGSQNVSPQAGCVLKKGDLWTIWGGKRVSPLPLSEVPLQACQGSLLPGPKSPSGVTLNVLWVWINVTLPIKKPHHLDALESALQSQLCLLQHPLHPTTSPNLKEQLAIL